MCLSIFVYRNLNTYYGSFKDIQSTTSTLTTYNGSSCPEFPENLWYVGDGNTFLLHPQSDVDVIPWTTGE